MTIRHASKLTRAQRRDLNKKNRLLRQNKSRSMKHEPLEKREMLASDVVPQLVGIQPNSGELLQDGDVRGISPRSLTFNFAEVTDSMDEIDPATLVNGIEIFRAGLDGQLGTEDDVRITGPGANFEGFIGIGDQPNQVVVRFGEALPDDLYRIQVTSALQDLEGQSAEDFVLDFELNLAPQVMSVVPQPVTRNQTTGELEIASNQIHVYFNDDDLDPTLATNPDYYQLTFLSGLDLEANSQAFYPESVEYFANDEDNPYGFGGDMAILTFAGDALEGLVSDSTEATIFRLQIGVRGIASKSSQIVDMVAQDFEAGSSFTGAFNLSDYNGYLQNEGGTENFTGANLFTGNNEFRVTRGDIASVNHTSFTLDDGLGNLTTFELTTDDVADPVASGNVAIVIGTVDLTSLQLAGLIRTQVNDYYTLNSDTVLLQFDPSLGNDRLQLRGKSGNRVSMVLGSQSTGLIVDRTQSLVIRGEIKELEPGDEVADIQLPGGNDEPGHRDIELDGENHLSRTDNTVGINVFTYSFPDVYGTDPSSETGEPFQNQITEEQKKRAREIFQIYGFYAGIEFVEVPGNVASDLQVVTGDLRALDPTIDTGPDGPIGLAEVDGTLAIMETADHDQPGDDEVGGKWQTTAFHEIGHTLGLQHTYDLPPGTIMGADDTLSFGLTPESLLPGDFDITHLQRLYRPDVIDIDMYRFDVVETGKLSAEVIAERLADSSRLDSALTLYRLNGDGSYTAIARNDDYFSEDSFLELTLEPGTYYIGVSASGNNVYDPNIEDSGFGGTSHGEYQLQLRFTPTLNDSIRDTGATEAQLNTMVVRSGGAGFVDGQTVTLFDGQITRRFEFDFDGTLNDTDNERVAITDTMRQSEVVAALVDAINDADFAVEASSTGNRIELRNLATNNPIILDPAIVQAQSIVVTSGAAAGAALDGDLDGTAGGAFNFWFRAESATHTGLAPNVPRTLFVDATYTGPQTGSITQPFSTISAAITAADNAGRGDVIRVIGLDAIGSEQDTLEDNIAYLIGYDPLDGETELKDGTDIVLPQGVTMMIDEGAILKFANTSIQVGSTSVVDDHSFAALQILGIPERYDPNTETNGDVTRDDARANRRVTLTSYRETRLLNDPNGELVGHDSYTQDVAGPGDWGGILFNQEVDREQLRGTYEDAGIFMNSVIGAEFRYAGGITEIDGADVSLAPIYMEESRPTINYNVIRLSSGAALSADPNSFEESKYTVFNGAPTIFTPDVTRVGPDIFGNRIVQNSTNGMLVRILSAPGAPLEELTVAARFDDTDIVYVIQEALHIASTPGGPTSTNQLAIQVPHLSAIEAGDELEIVATSDNGADRTLIIRFVDTAPVSLDTPTGAEYEININTMTISEPLLPGDSLTQGVFTEAVLAEQIAFLILRFRNDQQFVAPVDGGPFFLDIDPVATNGNIRVTGDFTATFSGSDAGIDIDTIMDARFDSSLIVDPNVVVKFNAGRIEVEMGANFIAEGAPGRPVVFTSLRDDRYGFGGTFDTNNDGELSSPVEGDWSGIYFAHTSSGSIDNAVLAYGGGESNIDGGQAHFNVVEIHQATVRITNTVLEYNADGQGDGVGGTTRNGHMSNDNAVIFVRDSQPIIVGNNFRFNRANVLNVDTGSLSHELIVDWGRSTGNLDRQRGLGDNQGALIRRNLLTENDLNAMVVRGSVLTTQSVWDDTDIVHALFSTIYSTDFHTYGGIRLESSATESLVVKLMGDDAGFVATGRQLDIDDRIGGMLHVVGQAGFPVVFTDMRDDSVGAGFTQYGTPQTDTNNDGIFGVDPGAASPLPGSWEGLIIDQFANDRNVQVIVEAEANNLTGKGVNGAPQTAQSLGRLAPDEYGGDDTRRLGFEVNGYISNTSDVDVYSFVAEPGTEVWFDLDKTSYFLDTVVELVDGNGNVLAASTDSRDTTGDSFYGQNSMLKVTNPLQKSGFYEEDLWSINPRDAGMRVVLPGQPGTARTYHIRVRANTDDLTSVNGNVQAGNTSGVYQLNIRLSEVDELAGSSIQFADIRYAENGIAIYGQPGHSPVLGESAETTGANGTKGTAQPLGNVLNSDRAAISVAGNADTSGSDVDWYEIQFNFDSIQSIPGTSATGEWGSLVIDLDYAAGLNNANTIVSVFDEAGQLIFISDRGAVNDDLMHPQTPGNEGLTDLSRGTSNNGDPYLGTIMLPAGTPEAPVTYYVAVSSQEQTPIQMNQFFQSNATNTQVRLEPINSVHRIVEDHINSNTFTSAAEPDSTSFVDNDNANPYVLGDFVLFLSQQGANNQTHLYAIDPFTGAIEARVGSFGYDVRDLIMAPNGLLHAYSIDDDFRVTDADSGNFLTIDTGDASIVDVYDDGIDTFFFNAKDGKFYRDNLTDPNNLNSGVGWGYQFEGTTFHNGFGSADGLKLWAIGNRGNTVGDPTAPTSNVLFEMDASDSDGDDRQLGTPEDVVPDPASGLNVIISRTVDTSFDAIGADNAIQTAKATTGTPLDPNALLIDGMNFSVDDKGTTVTYELDFANEFVFDLDPAAGRYVNDALSFDLDIQGGGTETIVFNTGKVIDVSAFDVSQITEGSTFQITNLAGQTRTFIFDEVQTGDASEFLPLGANQERIAYNSAFLEDDIQGAIVNAINGANFNVTADGSITDRITLTGDKALSGLGGAGYGNITTEGDYTTIAGPSEILVNVEETFTSLEVTEAIRAAVEQDADTTLSVSVNLDDNGEADSLRFNFLDASGNAVEFDDTDAANADVLLLLDTTFSAEVGAQVTGGVPILIGAGYSAIDVATAIAAAANASGGQTANNVVNTLPTSVVAFEDNTGGDDAVIDVTLSNPDGTFDPPFSVGGQATGGFMTGLAWIGEELYGVTDEGGVFRLTNGSGGFDTNVNGDVAANFINFGVSELGLDFESLSVGPSREGGETGYSDVLFGITDDGQIIAFQPDGTNPDQTNEQFVFQGGQSSIQTGLTNIHGLDFGTLNENLWHVDDIGNAEAGHGINVPVDRSRVGVTGGSSLYFGNTDDTFIEDNQYGNATSDNYNFPGDAHGSVITDPFSLYGYNAGDLPTLYFNYDLQTDGADYNYGPDPDTPTHDALRVFIAGDDGEWHLLATNNTHRATDPAIDGDDEFDANLFGNWVSAAAVDEGDRADGFAGTEGVQPLFDNTGWRQARIDLSAFAGQDNLRLRFDFSTGGSINLGGYQEAANVNLNTEEIRVLRGAQITDGGTFTVDDEVNALLGDWTFEYNKGQSFTFDSGARIADAFNPLAPDAPNRPNKFTLEPTAGGSTITFEYVLDEDDVTPGNVAIVFSTTDSPSEIAQRTREAIQLQQIAGELVGVQVFTESDDTLNIQGIVDVDQADLAWGVTVEGSSDFDSAGGNIEIAYNSETTAVELAALTQEAMNKAVSLQSYDQGYFMFNRFQEFIYGNGYSFDVSNTQLGHDGFLQGDDFGYASDKVGSPETIASNSEQRGQDNLHRGALIDDIIIGFAERGEMVTGATTNSNFTHNQQLRSNEILTGEYQLEIRRGTDYGVPDGPLLYLIPTFTFDTNDRLNGSYTVLTASGALMGNGDRIRIGDGTDWVTFEFFDLDSITERQARGSAGTSRRTAYDADNNVYSIGYYNTDTEADLAVKLMNAVNDHTGQIARTLISTTSGGLGVFAQVNARSGVTTSNRVDLSRKSISDEVRVEYDVQSNDAFREALDTGIDGDEIAAGESHSFEISGNIGDNDSLEKRAGFADIDVFEFTMEAGQEVEMNLETAFGDLLGLNAVLRLFLIDDAGIITELVTTFATNGGVDTYSFTAVEAGAYFVAIAGNTLPLPSNGDQASVPLAYDPAKVGKNDAGRQTRTYTGDYELEVLVGDDLTNTTEGNTFDIRAGALAESAERTSTLNPNVYGQDATLDILRHDVLTGFDPVLMRTVSFDLVGDSNRHRDQGQIIINSNMISNSANYGVLIDAGSRNTPTDAGADDNRPHPGAPINVPSAANTVRLATGVTVKNNVIFDNVDTDNTKGAILYSGDPLSNPDGAVPFGRIINNTLYGTGSGDTGVTIENSAGPTLMNNIIANFELGISVDTESEPTTVISRTLYQDNGKNTSFGGNGNLAIDLASGEPLFVDPANGNFYLDEGSQAIDAAVDAIQERAEVSQVVNPLGIDSTPLLAPERDITGQLRVDDPSVVSSGGVGGVTFRDIGAYDRADFTGPTGYLIDPQDNDAADRDLDETPDVVQWIGGPLTNISIQLLDQGDISDQVQGTGIDDSTVTAGSVTLETLTGDNPRVLVLGVDYTFDYDTTNNIIRLIPISGVFQEGVLYKVTLDSDPNSPTVIRDIANNPIEFNNQVDDGMGNLVGETRFLIQVGGLVDFGDAPDSYGTLLDSDGARHNLVENFYLGQGVDAEIDGQPTADASGDGSTDDGIFIQTEDPNNAGKFLPFTVRDGINNEIYVTAKAPTGATTFGFLDAWIDANRDGVFDDDEQILFSEPLDNDAIDPQSTTGGLGQLITFDQLPDDFELGETFIRFRLSSTGGLTATGLAEDGEVEDYAITIGDQGVNPWHNSTKPEAISLGDNSVTNLDYVLLLQEIRERNFTYSKAEAALLPGVSVGDFKPGFEPDMVPLSKVTARLDVNNDRRITSKDLSELTDYLNSFDPNAEPISVTMITGEPVSDGTNAEEQVTSYEFVAGSETSAPVAPVSTPSVVSESLVSNSSFDAVASSYSELQMRPAVELMGYSKSEAVESSVIDASFSDEAIALESVSYDDQFDQLIGEMADDLSSNWDGKQFSEDTEEDADELDELLSLISDPGIDD
ncbi:GEVED domain-containing protein [Bremerella sp. JC770]|uniref:GEVED domain-containing protein n=1 Tax=Bremerella sp. JC770 TaxID=3232137 RepID=UPI00345AB039